ncbi:DUF397 domain-containing protein [Streptomyces sp. NPDC057623]|uniref:DUF397 domain-containing protein n=1 Tax=Streptomyces sp. NPDC057623 TaxID=3346187 RepID=UPI0036CA8B6C
MTTDSLPLTWFKSSYSGSGGSCVEVAYGIPGVVPVRDSKNLGGPVLEVPTDAFTSFVTGVKAGAFGTV